MRDLLRFCDAERSWAVDLARALATLESPSHDKAAVDRCGQELGRRLAAIGARVERLPRETAGDHLRAEFGSGPRQVLVLGHFDTVWEVGQINRMPVEVRGDRLYGPGVYDMKAGLAIGMLAMRALRSLRLDLRHRVVFLCTSDEEIGSGSSRAAIEADARRSDAVLVLEPALPDGAVKTSRKGVGVFELVIEGVSAHAGVEPGRGASAIVELAHQTLALESLRDPARGLSVDVGVVSGGTRSNVVAGRARAEIDVRVTSAGDAARTEAAIRGLAARNPRARLHVSGSINRPPMERTAEVVRLYRAAKDVAAGLGFDLGEGGTGGASDGNFTAALGIPTLDGLGALGDGAHAIDEHASIPALSRQAALLAGLLVELGGGAPACQVLRLTSTMTYCSLRTQC
jgi:glutamate carboxypeptidase